MGVTNAGISFSEKAFNTNSENMCITYDFIRHGLGGKAQKFLQNYW